MPKITLKQVSMCEKCNGVKTTSEITFGDCVQGIYTDAIFMTIVCKTCGNQVTHKYIKTW